MTLEKPGSRQLDGNLPYSNTYVSTQFTGMYHSSFMINDKEVPPSMTLDSHILNISRLYISMKDAVEMIGEKFDEPTLEETIANSGLREHIASMTPQLGGSIMNRELNAQFLTPAAELKPSGPTRAFYGNADSSEFIGPGVDLFVQYGRATISAYDFPRMVSYMLRNTALQHTINKSSIGRMKSEETDPRLQLVEAAHSAVAA